MKFAQLSAASAIALGTAISAHAGTFNITFDGFCDGISVTTTSTGLAYGTETGCVNGPAVGTVGTVTSQGKAKTMNLNHVANAVYVIRNDKTWSIYLADGSELQTGTWSKGAPLAALGKRATGQ